MSLPGAGFEDRADASASAIEHLREASARIKRSEAQAEHLERRLRATEEKAAEDQRAAELRSALAEERAIGA
jgi:hypothetical protein